METVTDEFPIVAPDVIGYARIADGDIKAPKMRDSFVHQAEGFVALGQICANYKGIDAVLLSNLGGNRLCSVLTRVVVDNNIPALRREVSNHGGADTAGGATDHADGTVPSRRSNGVSHEAICREGT